MGLTVGKGIKWGGGADFILYQGEPPDPPTIQTFGVNNQFNSGYPYATRYLQQWLGISSETPSQFIFSGWFNPINFVGSRNDVISIATSGASGQFSLSLYPQSSTAAVIVVSILSSSFLNYSITIPTPINSNEWSHVAISAYLPQPAFLPSGRPDDLVTAAVNGVTVTPNVSFNPMFTKMGFNWQWSRLFSWFYADGAGGYTYKGNWAEIYFAPGQFINFVLPKNLRKFRSATGGTVDLGTNGQNPTEFVPSLYLKGGRSNFVLNSGTNSPIINWGNAGSFNLEWANGCVDSSTNPPA